jgi:SAM-dependent methyltransferase
VTPRTWQPLSRRIFGRFNGLVEHGEGQLGDSGEAAGVGHVGVLQPSAWVARFTPVAIPGSAALDLACGGGRHARLLLDRGWRVTAVDRDTSGVADLRGDPRAEIVQADLEGAPWPLLDDGGRDRRFGAVVVTNYLWRALLPRIVAAVAPGGMLVYETFARGNERFGKPSNPDFLLADGELLEAVRGRLNVLAYECLEVAAPRPAMVQRIAAVNRPEAA